MVVAVVVSTAGAVNMGGCFAFDGDAQRSAASRCGGRCALMGVAVIVSTSRAVDMRFGCMVMNVLLNVVMRMFVVTMTVSAGCIRAAFGLERR